MQHLTSSQIYLTMHLFIFVVGAFFAGVSAQVEPLIAGSSNINFPDRPTYMLSLSKNGKHICGAVAINDYWAITTADCVRDKRTGFFQPNLSVRAGTLDLNGGSLLKVVKYRIHPSYKNETGEFNFALLRVAGPIPGVIPPRLPKSYTEPEAYSFATIYGWGEEFENGQYSDKLKQGQVFIIPRNSCTALSPTNMHEHFSGAKLICAASVGIGTCVGDEGGPLMVDDVLVGIALTGKSCADPYIPSVFGNVGHYYVISWINGIAVV